MDIQHQLINDCIRRDRKAEYQLYALTYHYLMSICIRYTRNEDRAKEVLNIGFLKILTGLEKYKQEMPFKAWMRKVMVNTLINEFKKEKTNWSIMEYVEEYYDTENYSDINGALRKADTDQIYSFIASLPPASQQVFNLYFIEGYKHREIAAMLDISEGTSKWHLNFSREKLRELLKKNNLLQTMVNYE
jgi:RNA polymerase sigma factor (sigma-70 family)